MTKIMKIDKIWRAIEEDAAKSSGSGFLTRLLPGNHPRDFSLGLRLPEEERSFFFKVEQKALPVKSELPDAAGFRVDHGSFPGDTELSIVIVLQDEDFKEVFTVLLEDLVSRLDKTTTDKECVTVMVNRLATWQSFMKGFRSQGLTPEEQRGLFGELDFLEKHLIPKIGPRVIVGWVGPEEAHQDFQHDGCALEVKTTIQKKPKNISISSERQLDPVAFRHLFLWHLALDENQTAGETLVKKIETVRALLGESVPMQVKFTEKLNSYGYNEAQASQYTKKYAIRSSEFFHAREGFPRIVEADVMDGIGNIRYSITLDVCGQFEIDEHKFYELLSGSEGDPEDGD
jgi:hypothetical protein